MTEKKRSSLSASALHWVMNAVRRSAELILITTLFPAVEFMPYANDIDCSDFGITDLNSRD